MGLKNPKKTKPPGLRILAASKLLGSSGVGRVAFLHKGIQPSPVFLLIPKPFRRGAADEVRTQG